MDIASMATGMAQSNLMQQVSLSVTSKAMDVTEIQMEGLIDMMQTASPPSFGHRLDVTA